MLPKHMTDEVARRPSRPLEASISSSAEPLSTGREGKASVSTTAANDTATLTPLGTDRGCRSPAHHRPLPLQHRLAVLVGSLAERLLKELDHGADLGFAEDLGNLGSQVDQRPCVHRVVV